MPTRKNVNTLSASEKLEFVSAMQSLKGSGKYDEFVLSHANANMSAIHPDFALPYWNWAEDFTLSDPMNGPVWQDDFLGGNGDINDENIVKTGPFSFGNWQIINNAGNNAGPLRRNFGVGVTTLPSQNDINACLSETIYDNPPWDISSQGFRNRLEGWLSSRGEAELHNRGHVWVGGSMLGTTSPNDPIFFLHHCFVDLIWAEWQANSSSNSYVPITGGPAGQNLNDLMWPTPNSTTRIADTLDIFSMGYDYDILLNPISGNGGNTDGGDDGGTDDGDNGGTDGDDGSADGGGDGGTDGGNNGDDGGNNGDDGGTDSGSGGCASIILFFIILLSLGIVACSNNSEKVSEQKKFEIIENQELAKGVYWHFDKVKSDSKNLIIIDNGDELIHLEINSMESFQLDFSDNSTEGYIIDKDGQGFSISSGKIDGSISENSLTLDGEISSTTNASPKSKSIGYKVAFNNSKFKSR